MKVKTPTILNSAGKPIVLNAAEKHNVSWLSRELGSRYGKDPRTPFLNALGYEVPITTLTTIVKKISEQKFFEVAPADYLPVVVGQGSWSSQLTTYRSFDMADQFETGVMNTGVNNSRMAVADAAVDALNINVYNWAKSIGWSIFDLEQAAKSGNWDIVSAKEESRKKNWDLGIQRVAFLGARGLNGASGTCLGLLNQSGITINTTLITEPISAMDPTELKAFMAGLLEAYRANCNRTAWPTHFIIPESDYNGLASQASPTFPIKSTLELMEDALKLITRNSSFKILPLAYGDAAYNGLSKQCYAFLNYDEKSIRMDIPVDYTTTLANSLDNFNFQNAGYGQFTGVLAYRPLELMYFQY
jgi:hypothetical protein